MRVRMEAEIAPFLPRVQLSIPTASWAGVVRYHPRCGIGLSRLRRPYPYRPAWPDERQGSPGDDGRAERPEPHREGPELPRRAPEGDGRRGDRAGRPDQL